MYIDIHTITYTDIINIFLNVDGINVAAQVLQGSDGLGSADGPAAHSGHSLYYTYVHYMLYYTHYTYKHITIYIYIHTLYR